MVARLKTKKAWHPKQATKGTILEEAPAGDSE